MMRGHRIGRLLIIALAVSLISACSGPASLNAQEVWNAAVAAVTSQLKVLSQDPAAGEIRAEESVATAQYGELVGVFISPTSATATSFTVSVDSHQRDPFQSSPQDWRQKIIADMKAQLNINN
jgi:hypothetical protein